MAISTSMFSFIQIQSSTYAPKKKKERCATMAQKKKMARKMNSFEIQKTNMQNTRKQSDFGGKKKVRMRIGYNFAREIGRESRVQYANSGNN